MVPVSAMIVQFALIPACACSASIYPTLAVLVLIAPYAITGNLKPMYRNVSFMLSWFPHVTSNAHNPWFLVDRLPLPLPRDEGRIIDRTPVVGPVNFRHVGLFLWALWALWMGRRFYREPGEQSYLALSFLFFFGFYESYYV